MVNEIILKKVEIKLNVDTFGRILIHSWHLLPNDKKLELVDLGVCPTSAKKCITNNVP